MPHAHRLWNGLAVFLVMLLVVLLPPFAATAGCGAGRSAGSSSVLVFGDSYSAPDRVKGVRNWVEQLQASGRVGRVINLAVGKSKAGGFQQDSQRSFHGQVNLWLNREGGALTDLTVVYLGYNDVAFARYGLARSKRLYAQEVDRLIASGVTANGRCLILVNLHDWSRNPQSEPGARQRVLEWNDFLASLQKGRPNVKIANMFGQFEQIFANPGKFGFTNVTDANRKASFTTTLYIDSAHFGEKGFSFVAKAIAEAMP